MHECGVYEIVSPSGKRYIGSTNNAPKRWYEHGRLLARGKHHSPALQAAFRKYGPDGLSYRMMMACRADDLRFFEQRAIEKLRPEYNASESAGGYLPGYKMSDEVRAKISAAHMGRKQSPELIEKRIAHQRGRKHSPEHIAKIGAANRGKVRTPEQIEANRRGRKAKGPDHPLYGKPLTDERRALLSQVHRGKAISDDIRRRTSEKMRGMNTGSANPMARAITAIGDASIEFGSVTEAIKWLRSAGHKAHALKLKIACEYGSEAYGFRWKRPV